MEGDISIPGCPPGTQKREDPGHRGLPSHVPLLVECFEKPHETSKLIEVKPRGHHLGGSVSEASAFSSGHDLGAQGSKKKRRKKKERKKKERKKRKEKKRKERKKRKEKKRKEKKEKKERKERKKKNRTT
ncbi:unnamed protein product [Nyctereutes procyonoides]|uniref:(raccoon dog) hypothetical protein n=1 Tax=Nyctereutes procyonoides TaxID=34880 RepID=A0A811ZEC9_NYCPR|nr:unnamed protein product [Nyctereutes procyonoides]